MVQRIWPIMAAGLVWALVAAAGPHIASAQGLKAPDDPFGDIDLDTLKKGAPTGTAPANEAAPPAETAPPREIETIFNNGNIYAVQNRPTRATVFTLRAPARIIRIKTYHWNNGRGARAGTIALRSSRGETYGPWQATGEPGQGGVPNANWIVEPDLSLPAGTYTVIDSNPSTWAQNGGTGGAGMASAEGYGEE